METTFETSLIDALKNFPPSWALTPVNGNKEPYVKAWNKKTMPREAIALEIKATKAQGFGLLTGRLSGGIMAIDCDGTQPHRRFKEILGDDIPQTVAFTSGKEDRAQYLFTIPPDRWDEISTRKEGDRKNGYLEFRWGGCQSVLPPSVHPETGRYKWVNSPDEVEIAPLPDRVLNYLVKLNQPKTRDRDVVNIPPIPIERCLSTQHRAALQKGEREGNRDNMGASLVRDLIGVAHHVPKIEFNTIFGK